MSYLRGPRLVFGGQFQADVSTVNNDPKHFDNATFRPIDQKPDSDGGDGAWNPTGTGAWRLSGCTVTRVVYTDGTTCDDPNVDPIVGVALTDDTSGTEAKLVDLDSEQQMVSQIWGLRVNLGSTAGGMGFTSAYAVSAFNDIFTRYPQGGPDSFFGAAYQSVLRSIQWIGAGNSRFLQELSAGGTPTQLSIKFNVDGFNDAQAPITFPDGSPPLKFTFGRVVGSIGPYVAGEPSFCVAGRALRSPGLPFPRAATAYAEVDGHVLNLDLGNALSTTSPAGPLLNVGTLQLAVVQSDGSTLPIGTVPYTDPGWYRKTAGIASFTLTDAQLQAASAAPLAVIADGTPLLVESSDGVWLRADVYVFRLNPGDPPAPTTFYATTFGKPTPGLTISVALDSSFAGGDPPVGEPASALAFPAAVTTGPDGSATIALTAADPGDPRGYIDGQVYSVIYGPGTTPPAPGSVSDPSQALNVLVWSGYTAPANPTWADDVLPIFQQYANLYPVMKQYVNLSDRADVAAKASMIEYVFGLDPSDPSYMPVTRDLSAAKKAMILRWLANPAHP